MHEATDELALFSTAELPTPVPPDPKVRTIEHPIWTGNKAKLIATYLRLFVYVTKHGTYIDGFSGPQKPSKLDMWSAKLVLDSEPKRLRKFHLFELDGLQFQRLEALVAGQPTTDAKGKLVRREICTYQGDFNSRLDLLLTGKSIRQKEATFCLLDQRTFECHWSSVVKLADYKSSGNNKIELFYFLAIGWLGRALAAQRDRSVLERWWGRSDYDSLRLMNNVERANAFVQRFKNELGYSSVKPWPIKAGIGSKRIMYYMIHATDHPEAPELMSRAFHTATQPEQGVNQLSFCLG
jgi:three-Cys-motif partner protein